jgi:hypothetical protein
MDHPPGDTALGQGFAEQAILGAGAGPDAEESAAVFVQVGHVLRGGELAGGDLGEVAPPGQLAGPIPGGAAGPVIGRVAALDAEVDRHAAVAGRGAEGDRTLPWIGQERSMYEDRLRWIGEERRRGVIDSRSRAAGVRIAGGYPSTETGDRIDERFLGIAPDMQVT